MSSARITDIAQNGPRFYRRKLIFVPQEDQPPLPGQCLDEFGHEGHVHHGGLVHHDQGLSFQPAAERREERVRFDLPQEQALADRGRHVGLHVDRQRSTEAPLGDCR